MNWFKSEFNIRAWRLINSYNIEEAPSVTLIYGSRGVGKSVLLRHLYKRVGVSENGIITDSLSFARQYAYSAQENKLNMFRQRYRSACLLLIDDIQCLAGKVKTIEELYHTYEYIIGNRGKMVIAFEGDGPQLEFLGERLASRFLSGMVLPIEQPQVEEMERFLVEYSQIKHLIVDKLVLQAISKRKNNLADAVQVMEQFVQFAESQQNALSFQCFQAYWEQEENRKSRSVSPENIIRITALTMEVSIEELLGPLRKAKVNEARLLAIYVIRTLAKISFLEIGKHFNRRHSTIIMSYNKTKERLVNDQDLYKKYCVILNALIE